MIAFSRKLNKLIIPVVSYYAIYGVIAAFVEPLTWFGADEILKRTGIWGHIFLLFLPAVIWLGYYLLTYKKRLVSERFLGLQSVSSGTIRVDAFKNLRDRAKSQIIVVGIGMTNIVDYDLDSLSEQAKRVTIYFLMIDPDFLETETRFSEQLEGFLNISDFASSVRRSFNKLKIFCEDWNRDPSHRFQMRLKVYQTIPTNSMVIIDPDEDTGEIVVEFFLYHSGVNRPRLNIKKVDHPESIFKHFKSGYCKLWDNARQIV